MKVIFLDIDGVLSTRETLYRRKKEYMKYHKYISPVVDINRVEYLKKIIDETSAKVVISSSWRTNIILGDELGKEFTNLFSKYGIEIYDLTPFDKDRNREKEIKQYLEQNDVENYIIIDDEYRSLSNFQEHLLKIFNDYISFDSTTNGLLECHINEAIDLLNKKQKLELK